MAESIIQITAGSGTKLHSFQRTIGANIVEDEVQIPGEPYLAGYTGSYSGQGIGTSAAHLFQLMAGSSLKVKVHRIEISQNALAGSASTLGFEILRLSTAGTGGTSATPSPHDPSDSASGATMMALPSSKGTEGVRLWAGTMPIAAAQPGGNRWVWDAQGWVKPFYIAAGTSNGICFKITTGIASATCAVDVTFTESNF